MNAPSAARVPILVAIAMTIGAALRVWQIDYGLPAVYNPDEVAIMNRAVALGQNGLNPHNFLYPSLYFYALFVWEGLWFLVGWAVGVFDSLADFERAYFVDPTSIYIAGRLLSALTGVATVWATWWFGARLFGRPVGIIASLLLAVAPLAVRDAHYVKHDVPVTLLIVLALGAAAAAAVSKRRSTWLVAGALAGLATSTHYYAVFALVPVVVLAGVPAAASELLDARLRRALAVSGAAALAFAATSPFVLIEFGTAMRDITANRAIVMDRATNASGAFASLAYYLTWLTTDGAGRITAMLAAAGLAVALHTRAVRALVLVLLFPILFLLFIANTVPASRYLNPVLPFVAILAGLGASRLAALGTPATWLTAGIIMAAVATSGSASLRIDAFIGQTDTRTMARRWIEREIPPGTSILVQPYSVPLQQSRDALDEALTFHLGDAARASVKFQRQRALEPYPAPAYRLIYLGSGGLDVDRIYVDPAPLGGAAGLDPLTRLAVTYVVLKRYNEADPSMASLVGALERRARLVATFSPYRSDADPVAQAATPPFLHNTDVRLGPALERPGPIVDVWRLE
jgi:hypothetical protein